MPKEGRGEETEAEPALGTKGSLKAGRGGTAAIPGILIIMPATHERLKAKRRTLWYLPYLIFSKF